MKILFVCLGNICRSPMAEAVLRNLLETRNLDHQVEVDSAGTGGWHEGESADPRTVATLRRHGIPCTCIARQLRSQDFLDFDLLLAMDSSNLADMLRWQGAVREKVRLFLDRDVPDPYYVGPDGFEETYQLISDGCIELLDSLGM